MAKSAKKAAKKVKKAKAAPKAKKTTKAKSAGKKPVAKAAKKATTKPVAARKDGAMAKGGKKGSVPAPPKPQLNLNIFPALTQRPIAHKPAKSSMPDDKTRYSDEELKEFETLILDKLEKSREE